jgi:hypothetical protein
VDFERNPNVCREPEGFAPSEKISSPPPAWAYKYLCAKVTDRTEGSVEDVALRLVGIIGTLLIALIIPVIALLMTLGFWLAQWLVPPVAVIVLIAFAVLWRAGVLLRCAPQRDGSISIIKLVCFAFLGMFFWQIIAAGRFNLETAQILFRLVEVIFLSLAMIYFSLALASGTRIPFSAWVAIGCALAGVGPILYSGLKDFGLI